MKLKVFNSNIAQVNSYLLIKLDQGILIDPGFNGEAINKYCDEFGVSIKHVILTHGHYDHIKDTYILANKHKFDIYVSKLDKEFLRNDDINYAKAFGSKFICPDNVIRELNDLDELILFDETFTIIATPGHTKGSISIKYGKKVFTGDTLFFDSIGRTDLYSGNQNELFKSLTKLMKKIGNDYKIYPGHGGSGTLKQIKQINPYIK